MFEVATRAVPTRAVVIKSGSRKVILTIFIIVTILDRLVNLGGVG